MKGAQDCFIGKVNEMSQEILKIYVDSATRGNPGKSGLGLIVYDSTNKVVKKLTEYIGQTTNNFAEYTGLIYALQEALIMGAKKVAVFTDSELVVKQVNGEYIVKDEDLKRLRKQVDHLSRGFDEITISHIDREENRVADKLANQAIENAS